MPNSTNSVKDLFVNKEYDVGFFDDYPEFFTTSSTSAFPNRLNRRVEVLIKNNVELIKDKKILDIASHDGRFSFAAIKIGAAHVLGIEGRQYLVDNSIKNMERYGIPNNKYNFVTGDIHQEIKKIKPDEIDTVFCFGFFYHTIHHMFLLSQIKRLNPQHLIIDTNILQSDQPIVRIEAQGGSEGSATSSENAKNNKTIIGMPSTSAIELMLINQGFSFQYYDWLNKKISNWKFLGDYKNGQRITIVAKNLNKSS